jgi:perosamine synthetase
MAAGLQPGDDVIVPDFTFIATANAVKLAGGNVVLADVDPLNFCLTVDTVKAVITEDTRFVIPVEVNGRQPNKELFAYCIINNLTVITDSCEALGSASCGTHGFASCFSFSPNKLVTTGQGGMVVTNDSSLRDRLHTLKYQGMFERGSGGRDLHPMLGFNFKFNDILAAIGLAQLAAFPARLARCQERDHWYREALRTLLNVEISLPATANNEICLWTDILVNKPFNLAKALTENGIGCRGFWLPLHTQASYKFNKHFPVAESISARGIWLPSNHDITKEQVQHIAAVIKNVIWASEEKDV